jgi:RNA polymerase sigma-70 factor (ECF subfamily)
MTMDNPATVPGIEALLAHSGWVRTLSRHLVTDPAAADDIEQQAWLTALERPPRHGGNLRSWWSTVVRSSAGQRWREQQRRPQADSSALLDGIDSGAATPGEVAERLDTIKHLATAVTRLPEPYRSAIFLRYNEELPVREIAKRQGLPLATVQSHIHRGLEMLRALLAEELGQDWRQRCLVIAVPTAALVKTPLVIAACLAALVSVVLWAPWESPVRKDAEEGTVSAVTAALDGVADFRDDAAGMDRGLVLQRRPLGVEPAAEAGSRPARRAGSVVTVVDLASGEPIPGAEVVALDLGIHPRVEEELDFYGRIGGEKQMTAFGDRYRSDDQAQVRIPVPAGKLVLVGRSERHYGVLDSVGLAEAVADGEAITLSIPSVETIPVRVVDQAGNPVAGMVVNLRRTQGSLFNGMVSAVTGPDGLARIKLLDGRAVFPHVALGRELLGAVISVDSSDVHADHAKGPTTPGQTVLIPVHLDRQAGYIAGRVLEPDGSTVSEAVLTADLRVTSRGYSYIRRSVVRTDAEGRFRLLVDGAWEPGDRRSLSLVMRQSRHRARQVATKDLSRTLDHGTSDLGDFILVVPPLLVEGRILSASGVAIAGADVHVEFGGPRGRLVGDGSHTSGGSTSLDGVAEDVTCRWERFEGLSVVSDSEGRFRVRAWADGRRCRIVVHHPDFRETVVEFLSGTSNLDIGLPGESGPLECATDSGQR